MTTLETNRNGRPPRVAVLGATLGTGNLGVAALGASTVQELVALDPRVEVFYQSWVDEPVEIGFGGRSHLCQPLVIRRRPSLRQQNSVSQVRRLAGLRSRLGPLGAGVAAVSSTWRRLNSCDVVLDISAGDSFADIYGEKIFWYQSQIKLMCLEARTPLVLLPQTIGPFASATARETAGDILRRSVMVCTRETAGVEEIHKLCGDDLPSTIVESPDVAFMLEPSPTELPPTTAAHLAEGRGPLIAVNVSGLLYANREQFGIASDHADLAVRLVNWALTHENSRVLLTPHVVALPEGSRAAGSPTSDSTDTSVCEDVLRRLPAEQRERVDLLRGADDPAKAKYAMSQCDFFVGARMHAFIGAASLATPGALLAYSKKAAGTAGMVGIGDAVVDLRSLDAQAVVAAVDRLYHDRASLRARLEETVPTVKSKVRRFFQEDLAPLLRGAADRCEAPRVACN